MAQSRKHKVPKQALAIRPNRPFETVQTTPSVQDGTAESTLAFVTSTLARGPVLPGLLYKSLVNDSPILAVVVGSCARVIGWCGSRQKRISSRRSGIDFVSYHCDDVESEYYTMSVAACLKDLRTTHQPRRHPSLYLSDLSCLCRHCGFGRAKNAHQPFTRRFQQAAWKIESCFCQWRSLRTLHTSRSSKTWGTESRTLVNVCLICVMIYGMKHAEDHIKYRGYFEGPGNGSPFAHDGVAADFTTTCQHQLFLSLASSIWSGIGSHSFPEGPSTQDLRTLVPKTIEGMAFGTRILRYWVLGPSRLYNQKGMRRLPNIPDQTDEETRRRASHRHNTKLLQLWGPKRPHKRKDPSIVWWLIVYCSMVI